MYRDHQYILSHHPLIEENMQIEQRWRGLILGTAVGDSLGLVAEGISLRRNAKLFHSHWRQRFFLRWGMCSDDTEHTVFVAQALLVHHCHTRPIDRQDN